MRLPAILALLGVAMMLGCADAGADEGGPMLTLTGTVVHSERIALPPEGVLTVTVEDVSRADAPATVLGQTSAALNGRQSPIPFAVLYPRSAVNPGSVYAVRARITVSDRLLFTTTERYQVDPLNPAPVDLLVAAVPAPEEAPPVPDASLTDTYWKLVEVAGRPVTVTDGAREPHIVLHGQDGRVAGSGGVNRLMGGYALQGDSLTFAQMATTMMAGPPEAMQQEQAILSALQAVRGYRISGDILTLLDDAGRPTVKAVAVALG